MATVLVIDDEPAAIGRSSILNFVARDMMCSSLYNGWKGLQLYRQGRPDVIELPRSENAGARWGYGLK